MLAARRGLAATRPRCVLAAVVDAAGHLGAASGAGLASIGRPPHGAGLTLPALLSCPAPRPPSGVQATVSWHGTRRRLLSGWRSKKDQLETQISGPAIRSCRHKKSAHRRIARYAPKGKRSDRTRLKALMARHEYNYECCHVSKLPKPARRFRGDQPFAAVQRIAGRGVRDRRQGRGWAGSDRRCSADYLEKPTYRG